MMRRLVVTLFALSACDPTGPREDAIDAAPLDVAKGDEADALLTDLVGEVERDLDDAADAPADPRDATDHGPDAAFDATAPDIVSTDVAEANLRACQGPTTPLSFAHGTPYATVTIGGNTGWFLVDFGTTASAIDPAGFTPATPVPVPGTSDRWDDFSFFGAWATVTLGVQDFSAWQSPRQAGILGTDFLALHAYTVNWDAATLARAPSGSGCDDTTLEAAGLAPLPAFQSLNWML